MAYYFKPSRWSLALLILCALHAPAAYAKDSDSAAVSAVVARFHTALTAGDVQTAANLLAPDATILERGGRESRSEYIGHHLPEDIKFIQAVPSKSSPLDITVLGDVAWASSTSTTRGTFESKPVNLVGAELMVLTKSPSGWLIRAIHWSSRKAK